MQTCICDGFKRWLHIDKPSCPIDSKKYSESQKPRVWWIETYQVIQKQRVLKQQHNKTASENVWFVVETSVNLVKNPSSAFGITRNLNVPGEPLKTMLLSYSSLDICERNSINELIRNLFEYTYPRKDW